MLKILAYHYKLYKLFVVILEYFLKVLVLLNNQTPSTDAQFLITFRKLIQTWQFIV